MVTAVAIAISVVRRPALVVNPIVPAPIAASSSAPAVITADVGGDVPDRQVYSLLFRMLVGMPDGLRGRSARAFMTHIGLGAQCANCGERAKTGADRSPVEAVAEIERFTAFLEAFGKKDHQLDQELAEITGFARGPRPGRRVPPAPLSPEAKQRVREISARREALVDAYIAAMPQQLGSDTASRVTSFATELKTHIKVR